MTSLTSQLLRDIGTLARAIHAINEAKFKHYNLQKGQFIFVTRICENPALSLVALSDMLKMDKTTTTKAVQKLINEGYVRKEQDQDDKRVWRLFPTITAQQLYLAIIVEENRALEVCVQGLSLEEQQQASKLITQMSTNISSDWQKFVKKGDKHVA